MCRGLLKWFLLGFVLILAVLVGYYVREDPKYPGIHIGIKVIHDIEHLLFFSAGAYHGTDRFNRFIWDVIQIKIGSGQGGILGDDGVTSVDFTIPSVWGNDESTGYEVPVRLYYPSNFKEGDTPLPVIIYFHGGGFVLISKDDLFYDIISRNFVIDGNMIVLSVEYRLAPENKFPSALMDAYSAVSWIFNDNNNIYSHMFDREKIVVAGDSAGSMLSMSVSLLARDKNELNGKISAQVLLYPGTYYNESTPSFEKYGDDAYMLPQGKYTAKWFHDQYCDHRTNLYNLNDDDEYDRDAHYAKPTPTETILDLEFPNITQPYLNPWASHSLSDLPYTHMIAAEYDPLHDEDILLAKALKDNGVKVKITDVPHSAHGFFVLPFLPETISTRREIIEGLKVHFSDKK